MTTEVRQSVALAVVSRLATTGRTVPWLARTSGIPLLDLQRMIEMRADFTVSDLADIAAALDVAVGELTPPVNPITRRRRGADAAE
ncbi:hypothetical protein [Streptomyces sp. AC495_CC817]|uniref:hypothetical protein n=1 Tax=Streptomyces sp. AC495_CC817 TaxID=2823900 RepID=UPI001C256301|nr:hypothetical protein [Streptomyces sp. AC495_CC817]